MDCPVCLAQGENLTPRTYKGVVVRCQCCGVFRITKNALVAFSKLKAERRLQALVDAKTYTFRKAWPTISSTCL